MQSPKKTTVIREALRAKAAASVAPPTPVVVDQRALEQGRKPLASRRKDTAAIQAGVKALYSVPPLGLDAIPPIESQFKFSSVKSDEEFNFLQVELHLAHASHLLNRCAVDRAERDRLAFEKWKLQVELDQFFRLDEIQQRERETGVNTLAYERALIEAGAERSLEENHRSAESQLKALMEDLLASGFNKRMAARELSAWLSAYPLKDQDLVGDDATYTFDGARKTKPEHFYDAARMETDQAAWEQVFSLMARRYELAAAAEAGRLRKESLELSAKWRLADIAFRGDREQVARDAMWEKIYQVQSPNGVMNYNDRIAPIERRFHSDLREAVARLGVARRGLKELYGYDASFPQEGAADYLDQTVMWLRNASQRIAQFDALDQEYVLVLSLKELTKSEWETGLSSAAWTFDIGEELFPGQAHVRMRGLEIAVAGQLGPPQVVVGPNPPARKAALPAPEEPKPSGFWSARVTVPATAIVKHLSGESINLDQASVPVCCLGRVTDRDSSLAPEIAGGSILRNASPVGKRWKLALSPKSTDGFQTSKLGDVQLYLHLAVRAQQAGS